MSGSGPRYYFVDEERGELAVAPALSGVTGETRVCIYDRPARTYVLRSPLDPGRVLRLPLRSLPDFAGLEIKLQVRSGSTWQDVAPLRQLRLLGTFAVHAVTPATWGVDEVCVAQVRDFDSREILFRQTIRASDTLDFARRSDDEAVKTLELRRIQPDGRVGAALSPALRLAHPARIGTPPREVHDDGGGLRHSVRTDVTIAPLVLRRLPRGADGLFGVWERGEPVVEAMEFALGRQTLHFQPDIPVAEVEVPEAIYLGPPHGSWGHFLTQGLSRLWFALDNPDIPVLWHAPRLPPYASSVLDALGLRNQQILLDRPTSVGRLIIPFPGLVIGDEVVQEFTRRIGVVPASPTQPGRKIFLSRSGLDDPGGSVVDDGDRALDELVTRFGFEVFHPEQHGVREQLAAMSSAEVVLGVEGSALHTVLLLQDPLTTAFWSLGRHRNGAGVYGHIRAAKGLRYETLNYLREPARGARDPMHLDLEAFEEGLRLTSGLERDHELLSDRIQHPAEWSVAFEGHLRNTQVTLDPVLDEVCRPRALVHL